MIDVIVNFFVNYQPEFSQYVLV